MTSATEEESSTGSGRRTGPALFLLIVPVVLFAISLVVTQPIVHPDEAGTLTNARFLAGQGPRSPWWYLPGYGALLAPVLAFTKDLRVIYLAVHLLNAALGALTALGLFRVGRTFFPHVTPRRAVIAAVLTSFYPAYLYFASLAMADNLLITGSVWSVLLVDRVRRHPGSRSSIGLVLLLGIFTSVHSRAAATVFAAVLVLALQPRTRRLALLATGAAAITLVLSRLAIDTTEQSILIAGGRQGLGDLLRENLSVRAVAVLPFTFLGQLVNLVAATAGLVVLGVVAVLRSAIDPNPRLKALGLQVSAMIGATALLSALFTNQGQGDFAIYGRYLEAVIALPLFLGILRLVDRPLPSWFGNLIPAGAVMASCVLVAVRGYDAFEGRLQYLNFAGVAVVPRLMGRIDPIVIALAGAALLLVIARVASVSRGGATVVLATAFFANAYVNFDLAHSYIESVSDANELSSQIHAAIEVGADPCVALDQTELTDFWGQENYRVQNLDLDFEFWQSATGQDIPCRDLVVSTRGDLGESRTGWRPVAWENGRPLWLWASPRLLALDSALDPVRPAPGTQLPSLAADLVIDVLEEPTRDGDRYEVAVTVTNRSASTFVPPNNLGTSVAAVRVGLEWRSIDDPDERIQEPVRFELSEPLRPGATQTVRGALSPTTTDFIVSSGRWYIHAELVQEFVQWSGAAASDDMAVDVVGR